jgi:hypothetical protein
MHMQADYASAWRDYRKRTIIFWIAFLGYVPGVAAIFFAIGPSLAALTGIEPNNIGMMIALCWMIAFAILAIRRSLFRCPRCGGAFFSTLWYTNSFARKCVHCGLAKWAVSDKQISD